MSSSFSQISSHLIDVTYNLDQKLVAKLNKKGLSCKSDLIQLTDVELASRFELTGDEIKTLNRVIKQPIAPSFRHISKFAPNEIISSGCEALDKAFGTKGLFTGRLTQIYGEAGCGKSQICMQMCFHSQLPRSEGGLNAEALYIDTEDSFRPQRIEQFARSYFHKANKPQRVIDFKLKETLTRIHVRKINTHADDLVDLFTNGELELFLESNSNIRLLVVDSIAYHFRFDYRQDSYMRNHQLSLIGSKLKQIAFDKNIAILVTNQVRLNNQPALSSIWNTTCSAILHLRRYDNSEYSIDENRPKGKCSLVKSLAGPDVYEFDYVVNENGFRSHSLGDAT